MPWRGPNEPGEFPSLGYLIADWIEAHCAIPDGEAMGEPFVLTDEQLLFVLWHYRIRPEARPDPLKPSAPFVFRRSQLVRSQKWGKGPLGAAIICAEAEGPVLFDAWDADGEPVGKPWPTPWIQATAVSADQTDNVWRALMPMIELGDLGRMLPDTGLTRINLPGGGYIEPVTASAVSRLGQRITFALQDQTESWRKENSGHKLADNQRRNLAGMGGRSIETCNAWDPTERSTAQQTYQSNATDIHRDYPTPPKGDFKSKRVRTKILKFVYGDSWWVDLDRIEAECVELIGRGEASQAARFFGNRSEAGADAAFDPAEWDKLARPKLYAGNTKKERAVAGFDGARFHDSTALVVTHLKAGHQMVAGVWENDGSPDWEVSEPAVDAAVEELFDTWDLFWLYADPYWWESAVDRWVGRWGEKRVVPWRTNRTAVMARAVQAYSTSIHTAELTHDGHEAFARHVANTRRRPTHVRDETGHFLWVMGKDSDDSPLKIDLAMAGCLSWEARGDAIAAGALKARNRRGYSF